MFDIQGNKIKFNTEDLAIPPFRDYYNDALDKSKALKDIEYVVWLYKWNTPYEAYPIDKRASVVAKDVYKDECFLPTPLINELAKRFIEFQETPGTRLLSASQTAAEGIIATLNEYSKRLLELMDIDAAMKVSKILKDVGNMVKSIDVAMKQAKAEQLDSGRVKGGGVIGLYETIK